MRHGFLLVLGGAALAVASGCSEDPALYVGGPAGPPTELQLSDSKLTLLVGQTAELGVQPRDAVGNAATAAVQIATCDASMVTVTTLGGNEQWTERATVTALALGESCLEVTGASLTDTVTVRMGPASARIVGPDTLLSGTTGTYGLEFFALDGSQLTAGPTYPPPFVRSLNTLRAAMSRVDGITWDAAGQQPGGVTLRIEAEPDFGSVTAEKAVTIVPGNFAGTMSATSGEPFLDTLVIRAQAGRSWNGDEYVTIGGQVAINWSGNAADAQFTSAGDTLRFMIPVNLNPGTYQVILFNQGPFQITEIADSITVLARSVPYTTYNNPTFTVNTPGARIENKVFPLSFVAVLTPGATATSRSYYTVSGGSGGITLRAVTSWIDPGAAWDVDQDWINGAFTAFTSLAGQTLANPEIVTRTVAASTMEFIRINLFSGPGTIATQNTITRQ